MVGVALDMDDVLRDVLGAVALAVHDQAATDRTVGTGVAGLDRVRQLEVADLVGEGLRGGHPERRKARSSRPIPQTLKNCRRFISIVHLLHQAKDTRDMAGCLWLKDSQPGEVRQPGMATGQRTLHERWVFLP